MGFDEGQIVLNHESNRYYAGETVYGKLIFNQDKVKTFRGIYVRLRGYCSLHWTTKHTRRVNDREESYTVKHEAHEEYYLKKIFLSGSNEGEQHLQPGHYEFPFEFHLPADSPSSFESSHGHIRYELKCVVDRAFKFDQEKFLQLEIHAPLDLNNVAMARNPIEMEFDQSYCCWCVSSGHSQTLVKVASSGFQPGQVVPVEIACNNTSSVEIDSIIFKIRKKTTFRATHEPDTKHESVTVLEMNKGPVPPSTNRNWVVDMQIPLMDVYNLTRCTFIHIDYEFVVSVNPGGCHDSTEEIRPIVMGTMPLPDSIGDQPAVGYPTVTAVYPPPPIVNQPLTTAPPTGSPYPPNPYPNNSPYPNQPYPGGNQPYPGNSPYPGTSPIPAANPYPGQSPYPAGNSPYPAGNSPYPPGNTSLPVGSPYPVNPPSGRSSPYPPGTNVSSPYPVPAPYPPNANTSPYPTHTPPYQGGGPHVNGGSGLKTGSMGFMVGGVASDAATDGASVPLLPPGATPPYVTSPYSAASAPATTPDQEGQPLVTEKIPPYNPEFLNKN